MLLRIAEERLGETTVVHLSGRLVGVGVDELRRLCHAASGALRVDLAGLLEVDDVGLALLRSFREAGVELDAVSPFVQLLLDTRTDGVSG
jgi:ABC-type transporter Mla MlaB component